jgi:DedD protein
MEEKNELNDIILSKGGANSNSKKLLLAIAALTLILIIVLVIMNSLKTQSEEKPPVAAVPPEPTAPTEIIDDPLFEPVEVIQEGAGNVSQTAGEQDLGQIAQKIKEESMQNAPVTTTVIQSAPVNVAPQTAVAPTPKPAPVAPTPKVVTKPAVQSTPKAAPVNTPTIKTTKPAEVKKTVEPKKTATAPKADTAPQSAPAAESKPTETTPATATAPKATDTTGTYYIQVGSFTKEPNKALFDRLNASGLKYTTVPSGAATKVMVGPFQGEKAARDVLGTVKRNVESGAYIVKG